MEKKPRLSFWQIWNMSFGFLGIQFGFALQNANVSRIFETLGADIDNIPILWIAAPITGLIVQPIIGHLSDKTWGRLGRRRPFFLIGAIIASLSLILMPNSSTLWIAAGMLWIMDASINISMEPFRAFVGDMLPDEQRTRGFAMQSFFIGIGAVIASVMPYVLTNWFGISNTCAEGQVPPSVVYSFYIGAAVFVASVLWTVFSTKEYSPDELKKFDEHRASEGANPKPQISISAYNNRNFFVLGFILLALSALLSLMLLYVHVEKEVYILSFGIGVFGLMEIGAGILAKAKKETGIVSITRDLNRMPLTMRQLAVVQFFSWFALFSMWIYTTAVVTSTKYDMKISYQAYSELALKLDSFPYQLNKNYKAAPDVLKLISKHQTESAAKGQSPITADMKIIAFFSDKDRKAELNVSDATFAELEKAHAEYNKGADWVGICFAVYNGFAAVFAFFLIFLARITNRKITHAISLTVGGISLISILFINDPTLLLIPFIGIGLVWASILAMPYAILSGSLPSNKMGVYMGIFNFFIVIPQIVAASLLGYMVKSVFDGHVSYALVIGGVSLFIAAVVILFVKDVKKIKKAKI